MAAGKAARHELLPGVAGHTGGLGVAILHPLLLRGLRAVTGIAGGERYDCNGEDYISSGR
jgi:hypothetical protein